MTDASKHFTAIFELVNVIFDVKPESYNCDVHMFLENAYIY